MDQQHPDRTTPRREPVRARRHRLGLGTLAVAVACGGCTTDPAPDGPVPGPTSPASTSGPGGTPSPRPDPAGAGPLAAQDVVDRRLRRLEQATGARVGVHVVDLSDGALRSYRPDERFAHASVFKLWAAAAVLERVGVAGLDRTVAIAATDVVGSSPVTSTRVGTTMTLAGLVEAAVTLSDATAGNLLLEMVGGPPGLTRTLRRWGDPTTSVDRYEPDLTSAVPGDPRDTTTPRALATGLAGLAHGDLLEPEARAWLLRTLRRSRTGTDLVRAVVPRSWTVGDKTGTASYGTRNVAASLVTREGRTLVLAVTTRFGRASAEPDDEVVARVADAVLDPVPAPGPTATPRRPAVS